MKNLQNSRIFNIAIIVVIFFMGLNLSGCDSLKRKFTRKKKTPVKQPRFYQVKAYEKKPASELYMKYYAYWVSWQSELIKVLGHNRKKDSRCIDEIIGNLRDMQNLLSKAKADELEVHIEKHLKVRDSIAKKELDPVNRDYMKRMLEREERQIKRKFAYNKVKDELKNSPDNEPEQGQ